MSARSDFLDLYRSNRTMRLAAIDTAALRAMMDDDAEALEALKAERRRLLDFTMTVPEGTRAELAKLWPADFGEIPAWFLDDPVVIDDPAAEPLTVHLPDLVRTSESTVDLAAIIEKRRLRAVEEAARPPEVRRRPQRFTKRLQQAIQILRGNEEVS